MKYPKFHEGQYIFQRLVRVVWDDGDIYNFLIGRTCNPVREMEKHLKGIEEIDGVSYWVKHEPYLNSDHGQVYYIMYGNVSVAEAFFAYEMEEVGV